MAITVEMRTEISQLYVALFGRAPDGEGLGFWVGLRDGGMSLTQIADSMYATAPARDYYPLFLTNEEIIASFYVNVLGRVADAEGLAFWTAKLNAAGATPGSVITEMIDVVANYAGIDPAGLISQALFNNKVEVAQYYGEANGNIEDAATALATITDDHATVDAAIAAIDAGTIGTDGIDVTLTTGQDSVVGTPASDVVHGTFGSAAGDTYTAGDSVDLGLGSVDQLDLVATGVTASPVVVVKNTEMVNILDTVGGTFNALLVENAPAINFTSTLLAQTSMVTNAALGSIIGIAGKGNLTVDYLSTTGSADAANVSLAGVGTSATVRSTINVSDGNTVEKVNIATAGTNFVTLTAGSAAASVVLTGSGTNDFDLSAAGSTGALLSLDASASTGTNTFRLGTSLGAGDTVKGGTAADTVITNFTFASLNTPTMSGVETLSADFDAAAILDLTNATGLTTVTLTGSSANQTVQNALSSVTTLNVLKAAAEVDVTFGYKVGETGALVMNVGGASFDIDTTTITRASSLTLNTTGAFTHNLSNDINVNGDLTAFNVNVAAGSKVDSGWAYLGGSVGSRTVTVGANGEWSGGFAAFDSIGDITTTVAGGGFAYQYLALSGGGDIGNVMSTVTGSDAALGINVHNDHGDIGDFTFTATGDNVSGYLSGVASGGSIGNISVTTDGEEVHVYANFSAGDWEGTGSGDAPQGNIGDINVSMVGDDSSFSGGFDVSGGDIGNVSISMVGDNFSGSIGLRAMAEHRDMDDDGSYDDYAFGGNIGNVTVSIEGDDASAGMYMASSGGTIGDITLTATGNASLHMWISANAHPSGLVDSGNIGNITINMIDGGRVSGDITSSGGDIGAVTVTIDGDGSSGGLEVTASMMSGGPDGDSDDYWKGGNVGDVTLDINGDDANYYLDILASGGDIGNVVIMVEGNGASGIVELHAEQVGSGGTGGDIGTITATLGDDTSLDLVVAADGTVGAITVNGGEGVSAYIGISGGSPQVGSGLLQASIPSISVTLGDDSTLQIDGDSYGGSIGPITATMGLNADVDLNFSSVSGSIGAVTLTGGDSSSFADIDMTTDIVFGGVLATGWAGDLSVNLNGATVGTTVMVGTGGSDVVGTQGADNVFFGSGVDEYFFDAAPTAVDQVFTFTVGAGKDVLRFDNVTDIGATEVAVADNAAAAALTDAAIYVFADGSNTTTGETIDNFTTLADVAAFLAAAFTDEAAADEIIAVINNGGGTAYVYKVDVDLGAGGTTLDAAAVQLIGIVNATGAVTVDNVLGA